jgi:demethylmenaquinone methyltransferase / 2-methoxy-6-polyprenyl-1,4-benzoquinol methylase
VRDQRLPSGDEKARAVQNMFDSIAPRYDLVNRVMTFGMDGGWRRRTVVRLELTPGSLVIDVACGTGDICRALQAEGLSPIGIDFSAGMLASARTSAPLVQADALQLPFGSASIDGVTCGFALRNVTDLSGLFHEFGRVVRDGGRIALLEVSEPTRSIPKTIHRIYFKRVVPIIGGVLSDKSAYSYLPRSTAYLPRPARIEEMLRSACFGEIRRDVVGAGAAQIISAARRHRNQRG